MAESAALSVVFAGLARDTGRAYAAALTSAGWQVAVAADGEAALERSQAMHPDIVVIGDRLRSMHADQFCTRLKADARTAAIPVIRIAASLNRTISPVVCACDVVLIPPVSVEDFLRTADETLAQARVKAARRTPDTPPARPVAAAPGAGKTTISPNAVSTAFRVPVFDVDQFLGAPERDGRVVTSAPGDVLFHQGDACHAVWYIRTGVVKLSVVSSGGRQGVVGLLSHGEFFGEGCLLGHPVHLVTASAVVKSTVLRLKATEMQGLLREHRSLSDRFIAHMLARNVRIEQDLLNQLFNSSEKRLARTLLMLARYGAQEKPIAPMPQISQTVLAEIVGTSRSRVNVFMKKFERLGFIEYRDGLRVRQGLQTVLSDD